MKIICTLSVFLLANLSLFAQPVLNSGNSNPTIGETFQMKFNNPTTATNPGPTGANVTFDLSTLSNTQTIAVNASSPGSTYPGANILVDWVGGSQMYYDMNSNLQNIVGISSSTIQIPYSNPETQLVFPFQMGSSNTDTWSASFTSGMLFERRGTTTITADAWGTAILPNGTYSNVLRVKMLQVYSDSTASLGVMFNYSNVAHFYYLAGNHQPIAAVNVLTTTDFSSNQNIINSEYYLNSIVTSVKDVDNMDIASVDIFPNPTSKSFSISFKESYNKLDFKMYDLNGNQVSIDVKNNANQKFDIELTQAASAGMYAIMIYKEGRLLGVSKINFYNN